MEYIIADGERSENSHDDVVYKTYKRTQFF